MRITDKLLTSLVLSINEKTKSPIDTWTDGKANIGNYYLDSTCGAIGLNRILNQNGGCTQIWGLCSSRELYNFMTGYLQGLSDANKS